MHQDLNICLDIFREISLSTCPHSLFGLSPAPTAIEDYWYGGVAGRILSLPSQLPTMPTFAETRYLVLSHLRHTPTISMHLFVCHPPAHVQELSGWFDSGYHNLNCVVHWLPGYLNVEVDI
jgi:hypothetical protein